MIIYAKNIIHTPPNHLLHVKNVDISTNYLYLTQKDQNMIFMYYKWRKRQL